MADWIPANEDDFDTLANQFVAAIAANPGGYGLTQADATALSSALYEWTQALNNERALKAQWEAALAAKEDARATLTGRIRPAGARIQPNPNVTDAQRQEAGMPVHKTDRTPAPVPASAPILEINASNRLSHIIRWRDSGPGTSKARPPGVAGLELFIKVGAPAPAGIDDCRSLGMITRSPNLEEFAPADGGKTAYYIGRWVNTRSEAGPTSEIASATIAAQT